MPCLRMARQVRAGIIGMRTGAAALQTPRQRHERRPPIRDPRFAQRILIAWIGDPGEYGDDRHHEHQFEQREAGLFATGLGAA